MEPITTTALGIFLWESLGQPLLDKVKEDYAEETLNKIDNIFSKLPFNSEEKKIIEAEIINSDKTFDNRGTLIEFLNDNPKINELLNSLNSRKVNIEKSFNEIKVDGNNNSISF